MRRVTQQTKYQLQQFEHHNDTNQLVQQQQEHQHQNFEYKQENHNATALQEGAQNTLLKPAYKRIPIYDTPPDSKYLKRNKYGNFLVIYDGPILISLGPDYLCFLPTFICFVFAAVGLNIMVLRFTTSVIFWILSIGISVGQILSYFLMAISNPGIAQSDTLNSNQSQIKYCKYCQIYVQKKTYHCRDCGFCVLGYDHHCPWTSKCIGKNNLKRFYVFLGMTPIFIVYCIIGLVIIGANLQHEARMRLIRTHASQITNKLF